MHSNLGHSNLGRLGLGVAACLFAVALAACGGSSSKASGSTATTGAGGSTAATSQSSDTTSGSSGGGNAAATCKQLTYADVQPLVVDPITKVAVTTASASDNNGQRCVWGTSSTSDAMAITVLSGNDAKNMFSSDVQSITAVSLPGVGDKAARDGSHSSDLVTSMKGDLYCGVTPGDGAVPGIAQLEDAAGNSSKIGDKAYAEQSAAVGTLCNRIYGSGNTTPDLADLKASGATAATAPTTGPTLPTNFTLPTDGSTTP